MKKQNYLLICILFSLFSIGKAMGINIIPYPVKVEKGEGYFILSANTKIIYDKALDERGSVFCEIIEGRIGFQLSKGTSNDSKSVIVLKIDNKSNLPEEGYTLQVSTNKVEITSPSPKGIFYGMQSLQQLIERDYKTGAFKAQVVAIEDYPRFGWRGLMLDVSRTFLNKNLVKRYIDLLSYFKLNTLHWHLTDDQGWRIEIKRYPRLTTVGSKFDPEHNEMGGYYTQEDIREIIEYAALRNVTIVPEIELPGHACAAIAAYTNLSCSGIRPRIHPFFMGPGVHTEIFCAGKNEVYEFIYNVLDEVAALFPSPYIHIGGDEAPKDEWKKCPHCQKKMQENGLNNEEELQSYFVKRIGEHLRKKNKTLIGWDEIMEGGKLKGDEVVMNWRGWHAKQNESAIADKKFKVISCPTSHCYFDYSYQITDTKKVYSYEPVPENATSDVASNYIGVQANFWSHIDRCENGIDRMLFPRLFALAEVGWSKPENKNWQRFKGLAEIHNERLRLREVNCFYDKSIYIPEQ